MLIAKKGIFFPSIDNYYFLGQLEMTHDTFLAISDRYKRNTALYNPKTMMLRQQLIELQDVCKGDMQYYLMLLIIGMDTQLHISKGTMKVKKPILFTGFDNWDRVITELHLKPERLEEICNRYDELSQGTDYRKIPLMQQIDMLKQCCTPHELPVMLVNIGMDTQNWLFCNMQVYAAEN